jgi:hypothetical protein
MSYNKIGFLSGQILKASDLNHIEDGITNAVQYTTQELTSEQQAQAMANIGAQQKLTGKAGQLVGFDANGNAVANVSIDTTLAVPGAAADAKAVGNVLAELSNNSATNYNESIIGLSIDGQTITYIKGDGSQYTIVTQDTNTTYSIGTDEATGLTKLYATTGSAEDGTMTQKAIKTELDKKVGVSINAAQEMLVFTI